MPPPVGQPRRGKMLCSAGTAEAANHRLIASGRCPISPLTGRKPACQVGGPSLKTWPFWHRTSAALVPQQLSWRYRARFKTFAEAEKACEAMLEFGPHILLSATSANRTILVVESIHLFAPFFLDAKFFAASNALNAVPVLPT